MPRTARNDRELSTREMDDREMSTLDDEEYRPAGDLEGFTPPSGPGEHYRWVARTKDDERRYHKRIAEGYRAVKYAEHPEFRPWKNLIAAGAVQPDDVVTRNADLILMVNSAQYVRKRTAYYGEQNRRQVEGAAPTIEQQPMMPGNIDVQSRVSLESHRRQPRETSFGDT